MPDTPVMVSGKVVAASTSDGDVVNNQGATRNAVEDTAGGVDGVTGDRPTAQILEVTGREVSRRAGRDTGEVGKRTSCMTVSPVTVQPCSDHQ